LQIFYSVRSERLLMEQLEYNLLFRWFVGLTMDEKVWVPTVFTKNRDRLLKHSVAESFFQRVLKLASAHLSDEHFTVDGTLIEAWASQKSFQRKNGGQGGGENFHGQERKNETHESKTDPDAKLYRKSSGGEARLSYLGHTLVENRSGLIVGTYLTQAEGHAEREAALLLLYGKRKSRQSLRHAGFFEGLA
jgi:IS5 family transposase